MTASDSKQEYPEVQKGDDASDKLADQGVSSINGIGLVILDSCLAERHDNYMKLMRRIHKMIITVTIAEKEDRHRR